jgi:serine/threonine-protein kinase HipA
MGRIKKIIVSIQFDKAEIEVGELISEQKHIFFRYYPDFLKSGLEISPLKLKSNTTLNRANETPFDGLFGVFADSLPDGWGRLLLDRTLSAKGISLGEVGVLDRLSYVGSGAMGALIYRSEMPQEDVALFQIELDKIAVATQQIIAGTANEVLDNIFQLGGSSGGARPKILVSYNPLTQHIKANEPQLTENYEHWLIKFPSSYDVADIANIEYAYYKMATAAGIEMSECQLFQGKSGKMYFGTKRFDRVQNNRLHLHSAAGLMHDNFRLSNLDYGHLMDCAFTLEKDNVAYEKVLRLATFNVFAHNRDDHSKNFSFLMNSKGNWTFAPAYDLTFSHSNHGMHSTSIAGESSNPTQKNLLELANYFKVKNANEIIDEVRNTVNQWKVFAKEAGVRSKTINEIQSVIGKK